MNNFKNRLYPEWLIPFCERHGYSGLGFVGASVEKLESLDAKGFFAAIEDGLVVHEKGIFRAPCSSATERIFWEGEKKTVPRKITLWIEPIITMAGLSRLHREHGWPMSQLGMQSKTWAFDLVAYSKEQEQELVACEVKKSWREIEKLVSLMELYKATPESEISEFKGVARNAFKKIIGLRLSKASIFWALGPGGRSIIFKVKYGPNDEVMLVPTDEKALTYPHT